MTLTKLRGEYTSRLGLATLAAVAGAHPSHLARSFKQHCGMTPGEYLRRIRVAAALNDLEQSEVDLPQIAFRNGFADQSHLAETPGSARARFRVGPSLGDRQLEPSHGNR